MLSKYKLIYDFFDYEPNYQPDYENNPEEARFLIAYLVDLGYTCIVKEGKVTFKKDGKVFVGTGDTEALAIVRAFKSFIRSYL